MNIYELYFTSGYFRNIVDNYVIKHRTSYIGAFKCIEIIEAYKTHIGYLYSNHIEMQAESKTGAI